MKAGATAIVAALPVILGCPAKPGDNPQITLTTYLDGSLKGHPDSAYKLLSPSDRSAVSMDEYRQTQNAGPLAAVVRDKISYRVTSIEEVDGAANAVVEVTVPDASALLGDVLGGAFLSAFSSDPDAAAEELRKKLAEKYNGDLPMKTERTPFKLIRDEGRWYVFMDFAVTKRVTEALAEARKLQAEKKLDAALAKYDEVLAMKSDRADVRTAREDVENARKQVAAELAAKAARRAYIKSIDLYDLRAKLHRTYSGRIPGVDFKLKNNGDKTLNRVEVTVFFKDASGAVIHEEKYNPVLVSEFSFDRASNKPLKPNYVWQNRRGYFLKAESTPSEWKVGDVDAAVTDLEFAD